MRILFPVGAAGILLFHLSAVLDAQNGTPRLRVELVEAAAPIRLSGDVDSNSPAIWDRVRGRNTLYVMTSMKGQPSTASGRAYLSLGLPQPIIMEPSPDGGIWMETVIKDVDGTWYGYYHNETVATMCRGTDKVLPRIGAARSRDRGLTWEALGVILEAPPRSYNCTTENYYFVGGVGDFSVQLDPESQNLYFFYSEYLRSPSSQGVAIGRLTWADRDEPTGKIMVWNDGVWLPTTEFLGAGGTPRYVYPPASPIFATNGPLHDNDERVDAFWGPSVHWNTYVGQYVMLLNRAKDDRFDQEGIYLSSAPSLENPRLWSAPQKILNGGRWYPQILGLEDGTGTDKVAGEWARFFMAGTSTHFLHFLR
jgi:hypothetical protein